MANYIKYSSGYIHNQRPKRYRPEDREQLQIGAIFEEMRLKCFSRDDRSRLPQNRVQNLIDEGKMVKEIELFLEEHFPYLIVEIEEEFNAQAKRRPNYPAWKIYRNVAKEEINRNQFDIVENKIRMEEWPPLGD